MASHPLSTTGSVTSRRRFTPEFKRHLVELTLHPDASVAGIALAHQLNANHIFKWRREYLKAREALPSDPSPVLLPVEIAPEIKTAASAFLPESAPVPAGSLDIELGGARVRVTGAVDPATLRTVLACLLRRRPTSGWLARVQRTVRHRPRAGSRLLGARKAQVLRPAASSGWAAHDRGPAAHRGAVCP
jgi:transposase